MGTEVRAITNEMNDVNINMINNSVKKEQEKTQKISKKAGSGISGGNNIPLGGNSRFSRNNNPQPSSLKEVPKNNFGSMCSKPEPFKPTTNRDPNRTVTYLGDELNIPKQTSTSKPPPGFENIAPSASHSKPPMDNKLNDYRASEEFEEDEDGFYEDTNPQNYGPESNQYQQDFGSSTYQDDTIEEKPEADSDFNRMLNALVLVSDCLDVILNKYERTETRLTGLTKADIIKVTDEYGLTKLLPFDRIPSVMEFYKGKNLIEHNFRLFLVNSEEALDTLKIFDELTSIIPQPQLVKEKMECTIIGDTEKYWIIRPQDWEKEYARMTRELFQYIFVEELEPATYFIDKHHYIYNGDYSYQRCRVNSVNGDKCDIQYIDTNGQVATVDKKHLYKIPPYFLNFHPFVVLFNPSENRDIDNTSVTIRFVNYFYDDNQKHIQVYDGHLL